MAKRKADVKMVPVSARIDENTLDKLERIGESMRDTLASGPTLSQLVQSAVMEFVERHKDRIRKAQEQPSRPRKS